MFNVPTEIKCIGIYIRENGTDVRWRLALTICYSLVVFMFIKRNVFEKKNITDKLSKNKDKQ